MESSSAAFYYGLDPLDNRDLAGQMDYDAHPNDVPDSSINKYSEPIPGAKKSSQLTLILGIIIVILVVGIILFWYVHKNYNTLSNSATSSISQSTNPSGSGVSKTKVNFTSAASINQVMGTNYKNFSISNYSDIGTIAISLGLSQGSISASEIADYYPSYNQTQILIIVFQASNQSSAQKGYQSLLGQFSKSVGVPESYSGATYQIYQTKGSTSNIWTVAGIDNTNLFTLEIFVPLSTSASISSINNIAQVQINSMKS